MNIFQLLQMAYPYIIGAFFVSLALCRGLIKIAPKLKLVDVPEGRKNHQKTTPLGGGIGIFVSVVFLAGLLIFLKYDEIDSSISSSTLLVILFGGVVVFLAGLWDDIKGLNAKLKLLIQIAIAVSLFASGIKITVFVYSPIVNLIATVLWVVLLINAFNLLDTIDGLSASVALIIALMTLLSMGSKIDPVVAIILLVFVAALIAFLTVNFPPAKMFMGDTGSLFLGYVFAVSSVAITFYNPSWGYDPLLAMLVPLLLFSVPFYDTLSVCIIRIKSGNSILVGDNNHMPHRLISLGLSRREVLFIICLLTFITSSGAMYLPVLSRSNAFLVVLQVLALFILLFILETIGERKNERKS